MYSDHAATLRHGEALVGLGRELADHRALARGLSLVGRVQMFSDPLTALGTLGEALATARSIDDHSGVVYCLVITADANHHLDLFGEALHCAEQALLTAEHVGDTWSIACAVMQVAAAAREVGELDRAVAAGSLMELARTSTTSFSRRARTGVAASWACTVATLRPPRTSHQHASLQTAPTMT